jgi:hypothetical protein
VPGRGVPTIDGAQKIVRPLRCSIPGPSIRATCVI